MNKENIPQDNQEKIDFKELISALLNNDSVFSPKYLNRFSDLEKTEFDLLMATWPKIEEKRRKGILEDLEELAESNTLFFFENIFEFSMTDQNALIRQIAIRALWESDEKSLIPKLLELLDNDPEPVVQSQAAAGLGHFIYLGELGKFKNELINPIINRLIKVIDSKQDRRIQMTALESLGFSGDARVPKIIESYYDLGDEDWLTSSLIAMGHSADEQWHPLIMDKLDHSNNQIRLEAAKAAGLLEIQSAELLLISLTNDEDDEIRMAAAWSLSEIGGDEALHALEMLLDNTDEEEEIDLIQIAMDNLAYNEELGDFSLFDISPDESDDQYPPPSEEE